MACDHDHFDFGTWNVGPPEGLDNVGVEDQHQDEGKDVEEDSLEDAVDKTSVIAPVRDTACEVPEDVFQTVPRSTRLLTIMVWLASWSD